MIQSTTQHWLSLFHGKGANTSWVDLKSESVWFWSKTDQSMISIHGDGAELRATAQTRPCLRVARATHPTIRDSTQCYTALECAAICASTQCYNVLLHSAMMCSHTVLQCAAMCFHTVLQCATHWRPLNKLCNALLHNMRTPQQSSLVQMYKIYTFTYCNNLHWSRVKVW